MWKREGSDGKREDRHGGNSGLCWAVEEVALGGNDCSGPQELLAQDPLEESGTCRRFVCWLPLRLGAPDVSGMEGGACGEGGAQ